MSELINNIHWGIIGLGHIARSFAEDLQLVEDASLYAVGSRSEEKAKTFGEEFKAQKCYGSYDALLADPKVDIVYIATPHDSHAAISIKALRAGKHVLCEKPVSISADEFQEIEKTADESNRFFMEGLWSEFNPCLNEIKQKISNREIGEVKYLNAQFAFKVDRPLTSRLLDKKLAGGALLDIGIYPIYLAYSVLGIPEEITATAKFHPITGVDMQTAMIFDYPNAQALLYCNFNSNSGTAARISGTEGEIIIHDQWYQSESYSIFKDGETEKFEVPKLGRGYTHEIIECHECIRGNRKQSEHWSHQNSADLMRLLDAVREKIGLEY
ncbi:Gfo/Idh/MocA family protein [Spongiivirga citrea]|uniref:Gfo/Idh/MocA family oxidoreductase n=1 Tax=Spongiivirga citrea TaxID=1481457 RepID=A0A6M0CGT8_9FLAO|nr:Gfo/Idh/MocA family oxidoreductase [Spongiivirga citrea]NER17035.1 Gfo/Idh/MocA family oxidoreductase [Spongiivirga citrea]